ncbi:MAG: nucleoside triphosphate pyrophosphatase [Acidimicrobiales bacterium]
MTLRRLVLASSSPRRRDILSRLTDAFDVVAADIDETPLPGEDPRLYVVRLAEEKALAVAVPDCAVIGADTSVVLDGEILGKPLDRADAAATLRRLAGRRHDVVTGVAIVVVEADGTTTTTSGHERSEVAVDALSDAIVDWYVATGDADDKAGSYGLQGAGGLFADTVTGSVSNVIGLPMGLLHRLCLRAGVDLLAYGHRR